MAWASKEEEAMFVVHLHMRVMKEKKKRELSKLYSRLIFSQQGNAWNKVKWTTFWGVTLVTMWDEKHLLKNIQFAMILEMMGIGPMRYCVVTNNMPNFEKKLLLLISYLPHKKLCFYPSRVSLGGPFFFNLLGWKLQRP